MNNQVTTVWRASEEDIDTLANLFDAYRQFYEKDADLNAAKIFISSRIAHNESVVFLAATAQATVGFVQLYPSFTSTGLARIWILNDLFVVSDFRRKGIGSALILSAEAFAKSDGAARLSLATSKSNVDAQATYERLGWTEDREFLHYNRLLT